MLMSEKIKTAKMTQKMPALFKFCPATSEQVHKLANDQNRNQSKEKEVMKKKKGQVQENAETSNAYTPQLPVEENNTCFSIDIESN
ncbi:hypothetical protein TIFTF001_029482 [Ficus carica]|uniref:Uncharacterized protein n=1 Tax=Ficus carica TaxID=3494 RepID=A0AA88DRX6_FICCA|nr:hypothetical protein TIFTF001_029482 [Ficus carica]